MAFYTNNSNSWKGNGQKGNFYNCGKPGHWKDDCWEEGSGKENQKLSWLKEKEKLQKEKKKGRGKEEEKLKMKDFATINECTRGSPGSVPTGIFGPQVSTRILTGMFTRVLTPTSRVLTGDRSPSALPSPLTTTITTTTHHHHHPTNEAKETGKRIRSVGIDIHLLFFPFLIHL